MRTWIAFLPMLISPLAAAEDCAPTPGRTIGTHYDISKATHQPGDLGRGLLIHGRVLSAAGCHPLAGVRLWSWQAGAEGQYLDRLYAWRLTGSDGSYRFETEWPALKPPHIHFLVEAPGHRRLATQWIGERPVTEARFDIVVETLPD